MLYMGGIKKNEDFKYKIKRPKNINIIHKY